MPKGVMILFYTNDNWLLSLSDSDDGIAYDVLG